MCISTVTLKRGKSPEHLAKISQAIYDALVQAYKMKKNDRFHVTNQVDPADLIFDKDFGGVGPRTDDFMIVDILGPENSTETNRAFFKRCVELLQQQAGVRPEDIFITLRASPETCYSFGKGEPLNDLQASGDKH